jgi:hypothetical protein
LPEPVEAAAYFVVAEALTNVVRYADATSAHVAVSRDGDRVLVEVCDDGVGGADPAAGSGLRGLADRVAALDGRLEVRSPPGAGTTVRAVIPSAQERTARPPRETRLGARAAPREAETSGDVIRQSDGAKPHQSAMNSAMACAVAVIEGR